MKGRPMFQLTKTTISLVSHLINFVAYTNSEFLLNFRLLHISSNNLIFSESDIHLSVTRYHFDENSGDVEVDVIRSGSDLSHDSVVWCATRMSEPPSATPGQDYIPSSSQITFEPGETTQVSNQSSFKIRVVSLAVIFI